MSENNSIFKVLEDMHRMVFPILLMLKVEWLTFIFAVIMMVLPLIKLVSSVSLKDYFYNGKKRYKLIVRINQSMCEYVRRYITTNNSGCDLEFYNIDETGAPKYLLSTSSKGTVDFEGKCIQYDWMDQVDRKSNQETIYTKVLELSSTEDILTEFVSFCFKTNLEEVLMRRILNVHKYGKYWIGMSVNVQKSWKNVYMPLPIQKQIQCLLSSFADGSMKEVNASLGLPNKLSFLLTGPPGCGKTSLAYLIAQELRMDMYMIASIDLDEYAVVENILKTVPSSAVLLFDDADCMETLHDRNVMRKKEDAKVEMNEKSISSPRERLQKFQLILDFLDGYTFLRGSVVIFTANHPEVFDPAILRKGRMDYHFQFKPTTIAQFQKFFKISPYSREKKESNAESVASMMLNHRDNLCRTLETKVLCRTLETKVRGYRNTVPNEPSGLFTVES